MSGKKKEEGKEYNGWGGKRENQTGRPVTEPKRQRNVYVTEAEFEALKYYLWNVLRKGQSQANRKYKSEE